jgi:hypothetical protein
LKLLLAFNMAGGRERIIHTNTTVMHSMPLACSALYLMVMSFLPPTIVLRDPRLEENNNPPRLVATHQPHAKAVES